MTRSDVPAPAPDACADTRDAARRDARAWARLLTGYRTPHDGRSAVELAITVLPLVALWLAMWAALGVGYWLALPLALPAAGFFIRTFIIQHDCGHGSFFRRRSANDWTGRILGVLTMTPYKVWQRGHAIHHATSGHIEQRGHGDIFTLTVDEYRRASRWRRFLYRLFRNPVVMFGIGPAYVFLLYQRLPFGQMGDWRSWLSTMGTNLSMAAFAVAAVWMMGWQDFLLVHLSIVLPAAAAGVWLFFVQHQFEHTNWDREGEWDWHHSALYGSSNYQLPGVLQWFTGNIGVHHVHHLCSRIPFYRLPRVLKDHPELKEIGRLGLWQSLGSVRLVLWDEAKRRLVTFREARLAAA